MLKRREEEDWPDDQPRKKRTKEGRPGASPGAGKKLLFPREKKREKEAPHLKKRKTKTRKTEEKVRQVYILVAARRKSHHFRKGGREERAKQGKIAVVRNRGRGEAGVFT